MCFKKFVRGPKTHKKSENWEKSKKMLVQGFWALVISSKIVCRQNLTLDLNFSPQNCFLEMMP
jgi:hypothetical protein